MVRASAPSSIEDEENPSKDVGEVKMLEGHLETPEKSMV
jgi:hypothetical protein